MSDETNVATMQEMQAADVDQDFLQSDATFEAIWGEKNEPDMEKILPTSEEPVEKETPEDPEPKEASEFDVPDLPEDLGDDFELEPEEEKKVTPEEKEEHAWGELKFENKKLSQELQELREKVGDVEEISKLREVNAELEERLGKLDLAATTGFRDKYIIPIREKQGQAGKLLMKAGLSAEESRNLVNRATNMTTRQRMDLFGEEAPDFVGPLVTIFEEVETRNEKRVDALKRWREEVSAQSEYEKRTYKENLSKSIGADITKAAEALAAEGNLYYTRSKGDTPKARAWNESVDRRTSGAGAVLHSGNPEEIARYVTDGFSAREMRTENSRLRQALAAERDRGKKLAQEFESAVGKKPSVSASSPASSASSAKKKAEFKSIEEGIDQIFGN